MPSTFSPALRLELIGNGEQAGNWGNTTNTNLGTLLEQAITGVGSVTMLDADYTLTTGNGISDEARNAVVVLGGALTATRNVIVPTSNKFYAVRNATTGSQSVVVKTSGGTGVTLANGFTQLMYCDGTNVVLASVPINSTNSNVSVGGDLSVSGAINIGGGPVMPTGAILEYGGSAAPTGWLICDGSPVSRSTYAALFAVIGTAYGAGDGSTTFNVPDRRGRFGVGANGTYTRGSSGGSTTTSSAGSHDHTGNTGSTTLTTADIPAHNHTGTTSVDGTHFHTFSAAQVSGQLNTTAGAGSSAVTQLTGNTNSAGAHSHTFTTDNTGGGGGHVHTISTDGTHTHTVTPPYVASNFIIKI